MPSNATPNSDGLAEPGANRPWVGLRDLTIELQAGATWIFSFQGEAVERRPPELNEALHVLVSAAGRGFHLDSQGRQSEKDRAAEAAMQALARAVGEAITELLPPIAQCAIAALAESAATVGTGIVRLKVSGDHANEALLLPWEMIFVEDRFPVGLGELHLLREAVCTGADEGLPEESPPLSVVAHLSAPQGKGVVELNLEEAAFRMARALDPLRERTRFTEMGTLDDLAVAARAVQPVLLHFSGHGLPGHLVFEDEDCAPVAVSVNELLARLRGVMKNPPFAIWLSCCFGAGSNLPSNTDDVGSSGRWGDGVEESASLAADLHRAGIPQVLGYFGPVPDALAVEVDRQLFEGLAEEGSTLAAVKRARVQAQQTLATQDDPIHFPLAWTLLRLYHRGPDRLLLFPAERERAPELPGLEPEVLDLEGVAALRHGFIGRRRLLAEIRRLHREGNRILGLYGLGGLGKTATFTRVASLLTGGGLNWEKRVIVIPAGELADKPSEVTGQLFRWLWNRIDLAVRRHPRCPQDWASALANADQLEEPHARGAALARELLRATGDGVLYIDNAETLQVKPETSSTEEVPWAEPALAAFFENLAREGTGEGTVLLTTRYRPTGTPGRWLEITPCSKAEIFRMTTWKPSLCRLPGIIRAELAEMRLAGHPGAVKWVDALVQAEEEKRAREGHTGLQPDHPAEQVRLEILESALQGLPGKIDQTLALKVLLASLEPMPLSHLGECCAIGLPVPLEVVCDLGEATEHLKSRGLLTRFDLGGKGWAVHPFVRDAVTVQTPTPWTPKGRAVLGRYWRQRGYSEVSSSAPAELTEAVYHLLAAELWEEGEDLIVTLCGGYSHLGWFRVRLELLESLREVSWPEEQRATWLFELGSAYTEVGQFHLAESAIRESIVIRERIYGTREHSAIAASLGNLAGVQTFQGRYTDAEINYREAIQIKERVHGTREHTDVAAGLHGLANVQVHRGKYAEAEKNFREAIQIKKRDRGRYTDMIALEILDADIAISLHGLASAQNFQGKYVDAENNFREAIQIKERVLGTREHADISSSLHGLAQVQTRQGKYADAEDNYREAIQIKERVYGTRAHADIAVSLHSLADLQTLLGSYSEAESNYCEAIQIQERLYGTREHSEVATSLQSLANLQYFQGKYSDAENNCREAIRIQERVFGTREHADTVSGLTFLANVETSLRKYAEAEGHYREAIQIGERVYGTRVHASVALSLHGLAGALTIQGWRAEAEAVYRAAIDIQEKVFGTRRSPGSLPTLSNLAALILESGRPAEALPFARDAWEGAIEHQTWVDAIQTGAVFLVALMASGQEEGARKVAPLLFTLLSQFPADHPARINAEIRLGVRGAPRR